MKLTQISQTRTSKTAIASFGGYDHNLKISQGELYDMTNLSSDNSPLLSPRRKRGVYRRPESVQGLISKDVLCYVDGTAFVYGDQRIEMGLSTAADMIPKRMVGMGAYVIIFPDKKYINTKDITEYGSIEFRSEIADTIKYTMCNISGADYTDVTVSSTAPSSPANGKYWVDTSASTHVLKQYASTSQMWVTIATTYVKIAAKDIAKDIKTGDAVKLEGIVPTQLQTLNNVTSIVWGSKHEDDGTDDYIIMVGILDQVQTQSGGLTVSREMPDMDYVVESNNRLWGCKYGMTSSGAVNEIYACKLGDFKNWNCFAGLSTDSYTATVGSDGAFTGAITHGGYPIFFKENFMHKVYGNYPSNYQVNTSVCRGVQEGSSKSLAIVNEILYYKSSNGICAYDGSLPAEISKAFGNEKYHSAIGGSVGNKYYVSMVDSDGKRSLFVYDASRSLWHREDDVPVDEFCANQNELYFMSEGIIKTINGSGETDDTDVKWCAVTGDLSKDSTTRYSNNINTARKYVTMINVRMRLDVGSTLRTYIQYNSSGVWEHMSTMRGTRLNTFNIPLRPKRCDHFRLKFEGEGYGEIHSIVCSYEEGSDF